jgi:hypothetical protein
MIFVDLLNGWVVDIGSSMPSRKAFDWSILLKKGQGEEKAR